MTYMFWNNLPKTIINWLSNKPEEYLSAKIGVLAQKDISMLDISKYMCENDHVKK